MYRLYVERRPGFENEARRYLSEINGFLGIAGVKAVRYFNRYDIENVSDEVRQAAGEAFSLLMNTDKDRAALIATDCLRNLQIQHIQQEINKMTELMKNASTAEKQAEALKEVAALSKELARLKQQGR